MVTEVADAGLEVAGGNVHCPRSSESEASGSRGPWRGSRPWAGGAYRSDCSSPSGNSAGISAFADPKLLPPPHVFLGAAGEQAKFFNTAQRWAIGVDAKAGPSPFQAVMITIGSSTLRVLVGLLVASVVSISLGVAIRYFWIVEKLTLPTVTLVGSGIARGLVADCDLSVRHRQRSGYLHGLHRALLHDGAGYHRADRYGKPQLHSRGAHHGRHQGADLSDGDHPGHLARAAHGAAHEPLRSLDGGVGGRGDGGRLWPRANHHDGAQHLQPDAGVLHDRHHRCDGLHHRLVSQAHSAKSSYIGSPIRRDCCMVSKSTPRPPAVSCAAVGKTWAAWARLVPTKRCATSTSMSLPASSSYC